MQRQYSEAKVMAYDMTIIHALNMERFQTHGVTSRSCGILLLVQLIIAETMCTWPLIYRNPVHGRIKHNSRRSIPFKEFPPLFPLSRAKANYEFSVSAKRIFVCGLVFKTFRFTFNRAV